MTIRCIAITAKGNQCRKRTKIGQYCHIHKRSRILEEENTEYLELWDNNHYIVNFVISESALVEIPYRVPERSEIPNVTMNKTNDYCVCFDPISSNDFKSSCGHILHRKCILQLDTMECPFCRFHFIYHCKEMDLLQDIIVKVLKHNKDLRNEQNLLISQMTQFW